MSVSSIQRPMMDEGAQQNAHSKILPVSFFRHIQRSMSVTAGNRDLARASQECSAQGGRPCIVEDDGAGQLNRAQLKTEEASPALTTAGESPSATSPRSQGGVAASDFAPSHSASPLSQHLSKLHLALSRPSSNTTPSGTPDSSVDSTVKSPGWSIVSGRSRGSFTQDVAKAAGQAPTKAEVGKLRHALSSVFSRRSRERQGSVPKSRNIAQQHKSPLGSFEEKARESGSHFGMRTIIRRVSSDAPEEELVVVPHPDTDLLRPSPITDISEGVPAESAHAAQPKPLSTKPPKGASLTQDVAEEEAPAGALAAAILDTSPSSLFNGTSKWSKSPSGDSWKSDRRARSERKLWKSIHGDLNTSPYNPGGEIDPCVATPRRKASPFTQPMQMMFGRAAADRMGNSERKVPGKWEADSIASPDRLGLGSEQCFTLFPGSDKREFRGAVEKRMGRKWGNAERGEDSGSRRSKATSGGNLEGLLVTLLDRCDADIKGFILEPSDVHMGPAFASGASGEVHKGVYAGTEVAVKVFKSTAGSRDSKHFVLEFKREVATFVKCAQCPQLLKLYGIFVDVDMRVALVTKYMEGGTLFDYIHQRKGDLLPLKEQVTLALDVAKGMAFLHQHDITHRDLKSANVLLDGAGHAVVCDFGVAKLKEDAADMTNEVGTYRWMAPECFGTTAWPITARSDIYSFAIVLWELVTVSVPFQAFTTLQAATAISVKGLRPHIPEHCHPVLKTLMEQCWVGNPEHRPDFADIVEALQRIESSL